MKKESILMFVVTLITLVAFNASSSIVNADSIEYANTSKLGHMKSSEVKIYRELADSSTSFNTGETYLNEVFYIKKQAKINNELYYLISKEPSSQNGVIGWVKSTDIESRDHVTIDKSEKILYITGTGTAYNKAWGGSKNSVYGSLFPYKSREFKIHLTERVGNETWYRGILDGKTVFISESNLSMKEENATSKLGHLKSSGVKIYKQLVEPSTSFNAGETYLNEVFYIKKQATINDELYYLISKEPSSVNGVIGWVKSSDVESRDHSTIDRLDKVLYITGTGLAYNKAWGGSKNTVFSNLSTYKLREFKVHLTERVGNEIWYRGYLDGKAVFIKSDFLSFGKETTISKLGHIRNSMVKIFQSLGPEQEYIEAGETYTNAVYYIKKQSEVNGQIFYLISKEPSSTNGVVGWVNSKDLTTYDHVTISKESKSFYVKGTGSAYSKAWGGSKDAVYPNLSIYKSQEFKVILTEKVGNNTWYRGILDGNTVFIHESYLTTKEESATSKLGHLKGSEVKIYKELVDTSTAFNAGSTYLNEVFYIKKQAAIYDELYYLISREPSSVNGVIGWVKSTDINSQDHVTIDKLDKTLHFTGTGSAYNKAWGGSENTVYEDLSPYRSQQFKIHLTELVGNEIWYRGFLNGEAIFIHEDYLTTKEESATSKLGKLKSSEVKIYKELVDPTTAFKADETLLSEVFYIKKQATINDEGYYLISREPSSVNGVIGWVKSTDIDSRDHVTIDKSDKILYIKGTGVAYDKAWGGSKNIVYGNLSSYKSREFKIHLTERIGNETWYRGLLDGEYVFIHEDYLTTKEESATSKLGQLKSSEVKIYKELVDPTTSFNAGEAYLNEVFYIKKQATISDELYYLISKEPSSVSGVIGWVKSTDLESRDHTTIDKSEKILYITGTGTAYSKAWGGSKDAVYSDLSIYQYQEFRVLLTERVGMETWYRGILNGNPVFIESSNLVNSVEFSTSKLSQIRSSDAKIYTSLDPDSPSFTAGTEFTDTVFYVKKQAKINGITYYLISKEPSSITGLVGWVQESDLKSYDHTTIDKSKKILYIKGTGSAYSKAWGGSKDAVYSDLSIYKSQQFIINLTEKVGNNTWYRGTLNGKAVFIHESYLTTNEESTISKLGHIRNSGVVIFKELGVPSTSFSAGATYTNAVYYIKRQAKIGDDLFYLISTEPSSVSGVVGWVKSSDLSTYDHTTISREEKVFFIKGTGSAYSKAWGGSKDLVYEDLSLYKAQPFKVTLTEKVGNNTWYRGILSGKAVFIHESYLVKQEINMVYTNYDLTLSQFADIQMKAIPQTDKRYKLWIREDAFKSVGSGKGTVNEYVWKLRRGPGTDYAEGGKVQPGTVLNLYSSEKGLDGYTWYHVSYTSGWVLPDRADLEYYINSSNFTNNTQSSLQFMKLSQSSYVDVAEVNEKILKNKGILSGQAQTFVRAAELYGVNEIYLISHALLETGNGTSKLATGVNYNGKTVYNMYGINAKDSCPLDCGAKYAYEAGWFTPEAAIIGGAEFIGNLYIKKGQDTLYKMRWNPDFANTNGYASHQYATDIGWAYKQTSRMYELLSLLNGYSLTLEIPKFK